jgi:glycosidase
MEKYSYHGYAITDYYKTDPRHGTNKDYLEFVDACHERGIRVIMDMVFNHCGSNHWWMKDLPEENWIHQWPEFTRSNYRNPVATDPYASEYDYNQMKKGWFDNTMPDLNQNNEYLGKYLVQNSIWWIEYAGIDGIRMDTYTYAYKDFMADWVKQVLEAYPDFNIIGECWVQRESMTALHQGDPANILGEDKYLPTVTDFPTHFALKKALTEEPDWTTGLAQLYYLLGQDYLYKNPGNNLIFPDNHDVSRFYTLVGEDIEKYKMGIAFILTTRGIPMIYYGTEILMTGNEPDGHGLIRQDFPGGWTEDTVNCFVEEGRSEEQQEAFNFIKTILNWRKNKDVIHHGKLKQYIPHDNVYVYFRYDDDESVMVIMNGDKKDVLIDYGRFAENLDGYSKAENIVNGDIISDLHQIMVPVGSVMLLELSK